MGGSGPKCIISKREVVKGGGAGETLPLTLFVYLEGVECLGKLSVVAGNLEHVWVKTTKVEHKLHQTTQGQLQGDLRLEERKGGREQWLKTKGQQTKGGRGQEEEENVCVRTALFK